MKSLAAALFIGLSAGQAGAEPEDKAYSERMAKTMEGATVRTNVGPLEMPLTEGLANFLLDHPDFSAAVAQKRRLAPYTIHKRGLNRYWADDGEGTRGLVVLLSREGNRRVYFADGTHKNRGKNLLRKMLPDIHATAVIVMDLQPGAGRQCRGRVRASFKVYVRLRNPVVAALAKALRPYLLDTIARKFAKVLTVADKVGRLAAQEPDAVASEAGAILQPRELAAARALLSAAGPQASSGEGCLWP